MARSFEIVGAVAFFSLFFCFFAFVVYYASSRPLGPQPGLGWTHPLRLGAYGTAAEAARVDAMLWWAVMSFGVIAIGLEFESTSSAKISLVELASEVSDFDKDPPNPRLQRTALRAAAEPPSRWAGAEVT